MKEGRFEKFAKLGIGAMKLKEAARIKRENVTEEREAKRGMAQAALVDLEKTGHIRLKRTGTGAVDWAAMAAMRKKDVKSQLGSTADIRETMGQIQQAGAAPRAGLMGKLTGGGLVEGMAGGAMAMAGQFALPLAIAEAVKDIVVMVWDKNVEMNRQAETLASGGILAGAGAVAAGGTGAGGAETLLNVRKNLTPAFNRLGLNYDRNIKMAQAVIESGYDVGELTEETGPFGRLGVGEFAPGSFGAIQKVAATTGRTAGLTDQQSIALQMKLITQYREGIDATSDFMVNLNKDFKTAGISSLKYISILEETTGQFDRMNKSLDESSGVLRALSMTGRQTAEDLQASMKLIVGDPKRDASMQIYLTMEQRRMKSFTHPDETLAKEFSDEQQITSDKEARKAAEALNRAGVKVDFETVKSELGKPGGMSRLSDMMTVQQALHPEDKDSLKWTSAAGALKVAYNERQRADAMAGYAAGGVKPLDMQAIQTSLGKNAQVQANENYTALRKLSDITHISVQDLVEKGALASDQRVLAAQTMLGQSPTFLRDLQQQQDDQSTARLKTALGNEDVAKAMYDTYIKAMPEEAKQKPGESFRDTISRWSKDKGPNGLEGKFVTLRKGQVREVEAAYNMNDTLKDAETAEKRERDKKRLEDVAREAGAVTQSTADIFAQAFSMYFTTITSIIQKILHLMPGSVSGKDEIKAADLIKQHKDQFDFAAQANEMRIEGIKMKLITAKGPAKADLEEQLRNEEAKKVTLEQRLHAGAGSGIGPQDVQNMIDISGGEVQNMLPPLTEMLDAMHAQKDTAKGTYTITDDMYQDQKELFDKLIALKQARKGTDEQGNNIVTINVQQNSAEVTHLAQTLDDARIQTGRDQSSRNRPGPANVTAPTPSGPQPGWHTGRADSLSGIF